MKRLNTIEKEMSELRQSTSREMRELQQSTSKEIEDLNQHSTALQKQLCELKEQILLLQGTDH